MTRQRVGVSRIAITLFVAIGFASNAASSARAGTYDVKVCDAGGGRNHAWTPYVNLPGLLYAGTLCPTSGDRRRGIVARAAETRAGTVPYGAVAAMRLDAPPKTAIVAYAIRGFAAVAPGPRGWQAGIERPGYFRGCGAGSSGCSASFGSGSGAPKWSKFPSSPWLALASECTARAGCILQKGSPAAQVHGYYVAARISDKTRPVTGAIGSAWGDGQWHRGTVSMIFSGTDNSGVCRVALTADQGQSLASTSYRRDDSSTTPCPTAPLGGLSVDSSAQATTLSDGPHTFHLSATDAAGNTSTRQSTVLIDNTAPFRPNALTVEGGSDWRRQNGFRLTWQNPPGQSAPIVAASIRLCHQPDGVCADPQTVTGAGVETATIPVPGRGTWTARVWLHDAAGNSYESAASDPVTLRFDDVPPDFVAFERSNPSVPEQIRVQVHDGDSGVTSGTVEFSRTGSRVWHVLRTRVVGSELLAKLNDARLPDGVYRLRAEATDAAGNTTLGDRYLDSGSAALTLPLRARLTLRAGITERHGEARPASIRTVRYGRKIVLRGRLVNRDGQPVAGARIAVFRRLRRVGAGRSPLGVARTNASGRFAYLLKARATQTLRLSYPGTNLLGPAARTLRLVVRASSTLRITPRHVLNGERITLRGRVLGGLLPSGGKLFALQAFYSGGWRSFAGPFHTRRDGRWRAHYRFTSTTGRVVYRFRVFLPREADYPFAAGTSPIRTVSVRGL